MWLSRIHWLQSEIGNKVVEAIKEAEEACKDGVSGECAAAWDEVEELSAAASHLKEQVCTQLTAC